MSTTPTATRLFVDKYFFVSFNGKVITISPVHTKCRANSIATAYGLQTAPVLAAINALIHSVSTMLLDYNQKVKIETLAKLNDDNVVVWSLRFDNIDQIVLDCKPYMQDYRAQIDQLETYCARKSKKVVAVSETIPAESSTSLAAAAGATSEQPKFTIYGVSPSQTINLDAEIHSCSHVDKNSRCDEPAQYKYPLGKARYCLTHRKNEMVFCDAPGTDVEAFQRAMYNPTDYLQSLVDRNLVKSFTLVKILGMQNGVARVIVGTDSRSSTLEFVGIDPDTSLKAASLALFAVFH